MMVNLEMIPTHTGQPQKSSLTRNESSGTCRKKREKELEQEARGLDHVLFHSRLEPQWEKGASTPQ